MSFRPFTILSHLLSCSAQKTSFLLTFFSRCIGKFVSDWFNVKYLYCEAPQRSCCFLAWHKITRAQADRQTHTYIYSRNRDIYVHSSAFVILQFTQVTALCSKCSDVISQRDKKCKLRWLISLSSKPFFSLTWKLWRYYTAIFFPSVKSQLP